MPGKSRAATKLVGVPLYKHPLSACSKSKCSAYIVLRPQTQNQHSRLCRIQHRDERLPRILRVLCGAIVADGAVRRIRTPTETGNVGRPVLQHHGVRGRVRVRQLSGRSEEHYVQVGHQMLVLSLQKGLSVYH